MNKQQILDKNQPQKKSKRILIAEDDKFHAQIYRLNLSKEGYDIVLAADGRQTMEEARRQKPNLILLDLLMPVKDGFEVLQELKSDANLKNIKIIVLTNLGDKKDIEEVRKFGVSDFLVKANISITEMVAKVKYTLGDS